MSISSIPRTWTRRSILKDVWSGIGVDLEYIMLGGGLLPTYVYSYDYDMVIWRSTADPDPNDALFTQSSYAWDGWSENMYFNETYDASYDASIESLEYDDRKVHVEDCQRVHYMDVGHIVLAYPHQTYAWRTDTFSGWGDWSADRGRSLDACWTANPLLFDISCTAAVALTPYERDGKFSMLVPSDWTLEEDVTIEDAEFYLSLKGPVHGDFQTNILVNSQRTDGVEETAEYLESQMDDAIDELSDIGIDVSLAGSSSYWEGDNHSAMRFVIEWDSMPIIQDITVYADEESRMIWALTCSVNSSYYGRYEAVFGEMATSFEVVETGDGIATMVMIAAGGALAAIIVAVVLIYWFVRTRRSGAAPVPPQAITLSNQMPGFCQSCGARLPEYGTFCPSCGNRDGSDPPSRGGLG